VLLALHPTENPHACTRDDRDRMISNVSRRDRPTPLWSGIICFLLGLRAWELPHASRIPGTDAAILQCFVRTEGKRDLPSRLPHIKSIGKGKKWFA
jgi:hypothetical protein